MADVILADATTFNDGSTVSPSGAGSSTNSGATGYVLTQRNIGGLIAQVTVSEEHQDELEITQHPVETGAAITDHSFKRPAVVTVRAGWSNSNPDGTDVKDVYQKFLDLQASRQPISVVTGKRSYANMLIRAVTMTTDETSENALIVTAICQEIILVSTSTVTVAANDVQANAASTGGVTSRGTVQAVPAAPNTGPQAGALPSVAQV